MSIALWSMPGVAVGSVVGSAVLLGAAMTGWQWLGAATVLAGAAVAVLAHAEQEPEIEAREGSAAPG